MTAKIVIASAARLTAVRHLTGGIELRDQRRVANADPPHEINNVPPTWDAACPRRQLRPDTRTQTRSQKTLGRSHPPKTAPAFSRHRFEIHRSFIVYKGGAPVRVAARRGDPKAASATVPSFPDSGFLLFVALVPRLYLRSIPENGEFQNGVLDSARQVGRRGLVRNPQYGSGSCVLNAVRVGRCRTQSPRRVRPAHKLHERPVSTTTPRRAAFVFCAILRLTLQAERTFPSRRASTVTSVLLGPSRSRLVLADSQRPQIKAIRQSLL
jgi:hypothetical protein